MTIGYTPGSLYKRHASIGYSPGSHYKRFGNFGLPQNRNMSLMNRQAADSAAAAMRNSGPAIFETRTTESLGLSELAAEQVLQRAQAQLNAIAAGGESVSAENGGAGGTSVDQSA